MKYGVLMNKENGFEWSVYDSQPFKQSVRITGRWEKLLEIFQSVLVVGKNGSSKWICFNFDDYREALRAASSLRGLHGNRDKTMPYGYPNYWYVVCNVHDHGDHTEIWACKSVRAVRGLSGKHCLKAPLQEKLKIGAIVKNRVGLQYKLEGIWAEARIGWGQRIDNNSKLSIGIQSFCICENCITKVK